MATTARRIRPHAQPDALEGTRVAVALSDPALRQRLVHALRAAGCRVRTFDDPAEVLLDVAGEEFGAIVGTLTSRLDVRTLCRGLRDRYGPGLCLILVGGEEEHEETASQALGAGADDCLLDPTTDLLRAKLRVHRRLRAGRATQPTVVAERADDPEPPSVLEGHALLEVLGRGTYGTVYEARRLADGQRVALKLLTREVSEDRVLLARFLREVSALSAIRSPHVVRALATGHALGRYFLVMELAQGRPANTLAWGGADVALVVRMGRDVCAALVALQEVGLVHRDIKPANILVDDAGRATLVDFGLAKRPGDLEVSSAYEVLGTLPYLAPEVVDGQPQHVGSDLYALGASMWELLTGELPFRGSTNTAILDAIAARTPAPEARRLRRDVPSSLSWLLTRLMNPDPWRRLRDPRAARRALAVIGRGLDRRPAQ